MDPAAQKRRRQKRRFFWAIVAAVVVLPLSAALYVTFGPNPPIRISKQTTYITSPLDEDGLPDYAAALLAEMRKGVTPENNGAVPFLQAMWPSGDAPFTYPTENATALCNELGMPVLHEPAFGEDIDSERFLEKLQAYYDQRLPGKTSASQFDSHPDGEALLTQALEKPWDGGDVPPLAEWILDHAEAFELLHEAAASPDWFLPPTGWLVEDRHTDEFDLGMVAVMQMSSAIEYLELRVMYGAGSNQYQQASRDALAIFKLANHVARCSLDINRMRSIVMSYRGCAAVRQLAALAQPPADKLRWILGEMDRITSIRKRGALDVERLFALDFALKASEVGVPPVEGYPTSTDSTDFLMRQTSVDWNVVLEEINRYHDRKASASALPTRKQRLSALTEIDADANAATVAVEDMLTTPRRFLTPHTRGQLVADSFLAADALYSVSDLVEIEDRQLTDWQLTRIVLALAIYRSDHGDYPLSLTQLAPAVLPSLPNDVYGASFHYLKTKNGYLLYSTGPNQTDDGGSNEGEEEGGYGPQVFEGIEIEYYIDPNTKPVPAEQTEYDLVKQIPEGADDRAIRIPLPIKPWPWEKQPTKSE